MFRYILTQFAFAAPAMLGVITLSFLLLHLIPGDPAEMMLGQEASDLDKDRLRHELGLDRPLQDQYLHYLKGLVKGDLGRSLNSQDSVAETLMIHFPATVELALAAITLALLWGLPLGVWAAVKQYSWTDHAATLIGLFGMSVPGIFLGPVLIYLFAIQLDWFPVSDRGGLDNLVLPAVSLAIPLGAVILRMTRAAVLDIVREDYMRTARSKGLNERRIYFKHALRNALIPIVTIVGLQLGAMLTGTVITETIFDWPGVGSLLFGAIQRRDYPMVQGCVLLVATTYVLVNLLTDLSYGIANPKVRMEKS